MDLIYSYTRKQAIEDGVLVDVSRFAQDAGISFPVAMTRAIWCGYVEPPKSLEGIQDWEGRLWDVLNCLRQAASKTSGDTIKFLVSFQMKQGVSEDVVLKALCGPGDNSSPVITVMLPEED